MIIILLGVGDRKGRRESSQEARTELSLLAGAALGRNDLKGPREQGGAAGCVKEGRLHRGGDIWAGP